MYERHEQLLSQCMEKIKKTKVLVAGLGGLGSTVLNLLARTGFEHLYAVDHKIVDEPDLNRQILYDHGDLGRRKVDAAVEKIKKINPQCSLTTFEKPLQEVDFPEIDIAVDCLDNFKSRFVLDAFCQRKQIPLVHGGVCEFRGQIATIIPGQTHSLRDLYHGVKEQTSFQVFPGAVVLIACLQVTEVVKLTCGSDHLNGKILQVNLKEYSMEIF
ncbi:MAG: HesA/MoeB/ThiF family protein [Thermotogae bacterium]|nr:MAG: HesA/MoeB/ThiF family protein [Thermotogota bacterium]